MKKKFLLLIPAFILSAAVCVGITACGDNKGNTTGTEQGDGGNQGENQGGNQGEKVTEVTKEEWNAAISASAFTNVTVTTVGSGYTAEINVCGAISEMVQSGDYSYHNFYEKNGGKYFEYEYDSAVQKYNKKEIDKAVYDGYSAEGLAKTFVGILDYDSFTYNDGKYYAEVKAEDMPTMQVTAIFENARLYQISYTSNNNPLSKQTMTFSDYGKVSLTLPSGDMINGGGASVGSGEEITEKEWNAAISADALNRVVVTTNSEGMCIQTVIDGDKVHINMYGTDLTEEFYLEKQGAKYFKYDFNAENGKFVKSEITAKEYDESSSAGLSEALSGMLVYGSFTYKDGAYVFSQSGLQMSVIFEEGRLVLIETTANSGAAMRTTMSFSYDNLPEIKIPSGGMIDSGSPVDPDDPNDNPGGNGDKISEEDWNYAISSENFANVVVDKQIVDVNENRYTRRIEINGNTVHFMEYGISDGKEFGVERFYEFDGESYFLYDCNMESGAFTKTQSDEKQFNEYNAIGIEEELSEFLVYSNFRSDNDYYIFEDGDDTYRVQFSGGKIVYFDIYNNKDGTQTWWNFDYGKADFVLPSDEGKPDDPVIPDPEQRMTKEEWDAAISADSFKNVTVHENSSSEDSQDDNYFNITRINGNLIEFEYLGSYSEHYFLENDNGVYYKYNYNYELSLYVKTQTGEGAFNHVNSDALSESISELLVYENFVFKDGVYVFEDTASVITVFFDGGKLMSVHNEEKNSAFTFQMDFNYDDTQITLPDDSQMAQLMTEDEWNGIFNISTFENLRIMRIVDGRDCYIDIADGLSFAILPAGEGNAAVKFFEKDGEKCYVYEMLTGFYLTYYERKEISLDEYTRYSAEGVCNYFKDLSPVYNEFIKRNDGVYDIYDSDKMSIYINEGNLDRIEIKTNDTDSLVYNVSNFGTTLIELPLTDTIKPATEEDWNKVFDNAKKAIFFCNLCECENGRLVVYKQYVYNENVYYLYTDESNVAVYYSFEDGKYYKYITNTGDNENKYLRYVITKEEFDASKNSLFDYPGIGSFEEYWQNIGGDMFFKEDDRYITKISLQDGNLYEIKKVDKENDCRTEFKIDFHYDEYPLDLPTDFIEA